MELPLLELNLTNLLHSPDHQSTPVDPSGWLCPGNFSGKLDSRAQVTAVSWQCALAGKQSFLDSLRNAQVSKDFHLRKYVSCFL